MDTSITHIRPRFSIPIKQSSEEIMSRIAAMLETPAPNIRGEIVDNHIILDITGDEVHYWSPQLNFRVEADEENQDHSLVSGLIGPRPEVWTLFMFIYFSIGIIGFFVSSIGVTRMMLGGFSYYIIGFPITFLFMLTAYRVGKYGERLADDQMEILKQFIRDSVNYKK